MAKKRLIIVFVAIVLILSIFLPKIIQREIRKQKQEKLAMALDVSINDYPYSDEFPIFYFISVLQDGMTVREVHEVVRGYSYALNCWGYDEIYYFFGLNHNDSLSIRVRYDDQGLLRSVINGNSDSGPTLPSIISVQSGECQEGLLGE